MNYPTFHGNYLGIVVQNNDPLKRGRVKVFVPHISPSVYKNWTENNADKKFRFLGKNVNSDLSSIIDDLKKILPWAELSVPLAGETSSGRYNAFKNTGTISDSSNLNSTFNSPTNSEIDPAKLTQFSQNQDNIGEKPGNVFDISYYKLKDAFNTPSDTNVNNANKYSYNYTPECYSNCARGSFPVLNVGAHVWVFFNNGDPLKPVVFGGSFGSNDWQGIFNSTSSSELSSAGTSLDYPGSYENISNIDNENYDINTETYRNKYVINQKGGTLAFINTDNREVLKLTHYSGSFKEFNNFTNIELATNNDQKLVLNDQFLTVRGTRNEFTELDYDQVTKGDIYKKVGNLDRESSLLWKTIASEIADVKQLFDIQRADSATSIGGLKLTSSKQRKVSGSLNNPCPVCNSSATTYFAVNNSFNPDFDLGIIGGTTNVKGDFPFGNTFSPNGIQPSMGFLGNLGTPQAITPVDSLGGTVDGSSASTGPGYIFGIPCPACNPNDTNRSNPQKRGINPSSQGGSWPADTEKQKLPDLIKSKIKDLAAIEKRLGIGGSEIIEITKHKIETIGTVMNDFGSIRVDMLGKMYVSEVQVGKHGSFYNRTPTPLVELVHVDDLPGGNYTLNVCNRYNIMVGAGGVSLKSYGPVNISGSITNVAGEQVNISSELETNIDGGKRLSLVGDVVSIRQREGKQVVVEGSLGVTNNLIVAGGMHVEGELTANHITIPTDVQNTEQQIVYSTPVEGMAIGRGYTSTTKIIGYLKASDVTKIFYTIDGVQTPCSIQPGLSVIPIYGSGIGATDIAAGVDNFSNAAADSLPLEIYGTGADPDSIFSPAHSHKFKGVASTLTKTNAEAREVISGQYAAINAEPPSAGPK
jgi:hypothetical protein